MAQMTDSKLEKEILLDLYENRSENPNAFQKVRRKFNGADEDQVDAKFRELTARELVRGNVGLRNLRLTRHGVTHVEENYSDAVN